MAEREGFEPSMSFWPILTFQASAFDHSATAPHALDRGAALAGGSGAGKRGVAARRWSVRWLALVHDGDRNRCQSCNGKGYKE